MTGRPAALRRDAAWPGLRLALTTFTVLPVRPGPVDRAAARVAMYAAPLTGLLLGGLTAAEVVLLRRAFPGTLGALLVAALAVATLALLTRGMHLDGLADTADGLGTYGPPERALAAMRAPDVGAFGVATVALTLLVDVAALAAAVAGGRGALAVLVASVVGRLTVPWSCTPRTPAARPDGLGALVAGTTSSPGSALVTVVFTAAAAAAGAQAGFGVTRTVAAVVGALAVAHLARAHVVRRVGGVTGDVLGALIELATTVTLVVFAAGPNAS